MTPNTIICLNKQGWTQKQIAERLGIHQSTLNKMCKRVGIKLQRNYSKGENHYLYKGYETHDGRGCPTRKIGDRYIRKHRLVAEKILGRPPLPDELVHHINGDVTDNRPENIQIVSRSEHKKLHPEIGVETRFGGRCDPSRI